VKSPEEPALRRRIPKREKGGRLGGGRIGVPGTCDWQRKEEGKGREERRGIWGGQFQERQEP